MESNDKRSSRISNYSSRKRRSSGKSNSSYDRREFRAEGMGQDLESSRNYISFLLDRPESDNRRLEENFDRMRAEFQAIRTENQDLKSKIRNLQQQYDRLVSQNRQLELRVHQIEQRSPITNQDVPQQANSFEQHSREIQP